MFSLAGDGVPGKGLACSGGEGRGGENSPGPRAHPHLRSLPGYHSPCHCPRAPATVLLSARTGGSTEVAVPRCPPGLHDDAQERSAVPAPPSISSLNWVQSDAISPMTRVIIPRPPDRPSHQDGDSLPPRPSPPRAPTSPQEVSTTRTRPPSPRAGMIALTTWPGCAPASRRRSVPRAPTGWRACCA